MGEVTGVGAIVDGEVERPSSGPEQPKKLTARIDIASDAIEKLLRDGGIVEVVCKIRIV
jgi:hypothetical protein